MSAWSRSGFAICTVAILVFGLAGCGATSYGPHVEVEWHTSYDDALAEAKENNKPILMLFTGSDWCPPCKALEEEVFATQEFSDWSAENVVLLKLDFPRNKPQTDELIAQNQQLQLDHRIEGYPTVLLLTSDLKRIGQLGYESGGPNSWIKKADRHLSRG